MTAGTVSCTAMPRAASPIHLIPDQATTMDPHPHGRQRLPLPSSRPAERWARIRRHLRPAVLVAAALPWRSAGAALLLTTLASPGEATDFTTGGAAYSAGSAAGGAMLDTVAGSVNSFTNLLMGPGMFVIMAIGALLSLYGFGRGNKETLFTGIGLFILAAIVRGIWGALV
jgi:hypothetical protein